MDYSKYDGHTPGPWARANSNHQGNINAGDGTFAFDVHCWNRGTLAVDANLNLIADAPALLERCKRLEAIVREVAGHTPGVELGTAIRHAQEFLVEDDTP
jgi:hypothetical protein